MASAMKVAVALAGLAAMGQGAAVTSESPRRFDGHRVVRCTPRTAAAASAVRGIASEHPYTDWWRSPASAGLPADARLGPHDASVTAALWAVPDTNCTTLIPDVQRLIDTENNPAVHPSNRARRQANDPWTWGYHEYDEIIRHFTEDVVPKHSRIASTFSIGKSYEGREQLVVRVSAGTHAVDSNGTAVSNALPAFWLEALIHSREWITGAAMYWIIEAILEGYGTNDDITKLVNKMDLYFLLVANPDGYAYTQTDRMWRKTRAPNAGTTCVGTDPNRNWDFHWCEAGASTNPCDDRYCGDRAASQIEVANIQKFVGDHGSIAAFLDFHAYSQLWLTPWGWTSALPDRNDYEEQQACARRATEALTAVHGKRYTYGPISTTIYPAAGSSVDWVYGVHDVKLAFGPEGRDTGQFGFMLPWTEIVPSGQENLAAVLATAECALSASGAEI